MTHPSLIYASAVLALASCTTQEATTAWERKGDVVVVHHIQGLTDHVEKLMLKKVDTKTAQAMPLAKGQYYQVVATDQHLAPVKPATPKKETAPTGDKLAAVNAELRELKDQISSVKAENKRLQAQVSKASPDPTPALSATNQEAVNSVTDSEPPRVSQ